MSLNPVAVSIQAPARTGDGAGGKGISWNVVATGFATINFYRKESLLRLEQAAHNAQGPGVNTKTLRLIVFESPFPTILVEYRIVAADGTKYVVQDVRPYDDWLEVDTEIIE